MTEPRSILSLTGADVIPFLQGLVSNDLRHLDRSAVHTALLTPQGKYLADFFVIGRPDGALIDVDARLEQDLVRRLSMYKLRADVTIAPSPEGVICGTGPAPDGALSDPRHPGMGWRLYGTDLPPQPDGIDWDALRVAHVVPATLVELIPNESYILEAGFERLHGVDFRKGCYVGQEVTARMKHKTELKRGLVRVAIAGTPPAPGTAIETGAGREVGRLTTVSGQAGLAMLRLDHAAEDLHAGGARITLGPDPA
ncbi:CAF17-like 4Fe-4S cluster assembly/insertion protein YgfZ [Phaeovulum vinaykumarii]|uniref:CAF17 C-terminal domain-containing protein n=1 Tax=Phaeovulum vinaykumarii TaxID=407234 RepID=A0A1N7JTZ0_9RHOB|nr:folate-binding protein YgfZ [Phaeovulum vinaykumarii]SIS52832.1 hypothetical protein SAMN05421795_101335 [Phaeovulum vinaykumarii]SOB91389.1 hypothetical protein SAMN05878426_101335 [Phaeovulum vinaykumarii]